ncbi:MAG: protein O-mannosyl-transferase family [Anaerolineae bacterium]
MSYLGHILPFLGIGVVVAAVYGLTIAPSLTWEHWGTDGGDLVTSAVTGRVSHPPGAPLYFYLSLAAVRIWPGDPARVLNGVSSVMALGAAIVTAAVLRRLQVSWWAAAGAALSLAFSSWLWSQAVITEIYTTGALLTGLTLLLREIVPPERPVAAFVLGAMVGLAASVHLTLLVLAVYVGIAAGEHWPVALAGLLLGLVPSYALLPLFGPWPQPWGDLRTFAGWWTYVSGRFYWGNAFGLALSYWLRRALAWASLMSRQFTPVGLVLTVLGARALWRGERRRAAGLLVAILGASLYAIGYDSADSWVYLVGLMPALALILGLGLEEARRWGMPAGLSLLLPLALVVLNWGHMDVHNDYQAAHWLERTLEQLPSDAAVVTQQDRHTFALWYARDALGRRQDLLIVDRQLWGYEPYNVFLFGERARAVEQLDDVVSQRPWCEIGPDGEVSCL